MELDKSRERKRNKRQDKTTCIYRGKKEKWSEMKTEIEREKETESDS